MGKDYAHSQGGIHRHTGGLENWYAFSNSRTSIHRHTGGLEKKKKRHTDG